MSGLRTPQVGVILVWGRARVAWQGAARCACCVARGRGWVARSTTREGSAPMVSGGVWELWLLVWVLLTLLQTEGIRIVNDFHTVYTSDGRRGCSLINSRICCCRHERIQCCACTGLYKVMFHGVICLAQAFPALSFPGLILVFSLLHAFAWDVCLLLWLCF